jgi:hypothetical protein
MTVGRISRFELEIRVTIEILPCSDEKIPVVRLDQLSVAEKRAFVIADNKIAQEAGLGPGVPGDRTRRTRRPLARRGDGRFADRFAGQGSFYRSRHELIAVFKCSGRGVRRRPTCESPPRKYNFRALLAEPGLTRIVVDVEFNSKYREA